MRSETLPADEMFGRMCMGRGEGGGDGRGRWEGVKGGGGKGGVKEG